MDKKNNFIGLTCVVLSLVLMFTYRPKVQTSTAKETVSQNIADNKQSQIDDSILEINNDASLANVIAEEEIVTLSNDMISVDFTTVGGAIKHVALKDFKAVQGGSDPVVFNDPCQIPALAMTTKSFRDYDQLDKYDIVASSDLSVTFRKIISNDIVILREYSIVAKDSTETDSYVVKHTTVIKNNSDKKFNCGDIFLGVGSIPSTDSDATGDYLNFGYFDGKDAEFIKIRDFAASSGFFGIGKHLAQEKISEQKQIIWGSIKNQFFTSILTPSIVANGFETWPVKLFDSINMTADEGISGNLRFIVGEIEPGSEYKLSADFYAGPKDFKRLDSMSQQQDRVMQFGFFGIISKFLLLIMGGIHSLIPNWGITIILLTTLVKLVLWPLTTAQVRSSKKMAALQKPIKELKERYGNNKQKIQVETMKLFKQNRVNPAAGCLPIFVQIPIFLGLYYMLRTASDLRFAHFLWINDLSLADTVWHLGKFPINILPVIMLITMVFQMRMTPMPNTDGTQKMMMRIMPAMFLFFCYNFPSGLVLYWTVQNLLTIVQQIIISRRSDMQFAPIIQEHGDHRRQRKFKK